MRQLTWNAVAGRALVLLVVVILGGLGAWAQPAAAVPTAAEREAEAAVQRKDYQAALLSLQQALREKPGDPRIRAKIVEVTLTMRAAASPAAPTPANDLMSSPEPEPGPDESTMAQAMPDGKAGATPQTESMPLDLSSLAALRKQHLGKPEFRAAWITRFDWATTETEVMRQNIVTLMQNAKDIGLNAVLFQVRGEATTLYPSKLEPWSKLVGGKDPGYDPCRLAIDEAHKHGLEFHAYFNIASCTAERNEPSSPDHVWYKHCMPDSNPNWLVYQGGQPASFNEYSWFNVNLPEVQTYVRAAAVDLISRYDVEGLHYDRVRFPNSDVSDDPWSKARFEGDGNPARLGWHEWQRDNLNRLLIDIYGAVTAIRPKLKISASVWGIYDKTQMPGYERTSSGLQNYNQDSIAWTRLGCMDALVPMIYWEMGANKPDYDDLLAYFHNNSANGRHVYGGQRVFTRVEMLRQTVATSLIGAEGVCPFTLKRLVERGLLGFYRKHIFVGNVPTPEMPWKTNPTKGTVLVTVKDSSGKAVMDAHVTMPGRDYVWLSSADGFCAIIDAEPGQHKLSAVKPSLGLSGVSRPFVVEKGRATRMEVVVKAGQP